MRGKKPTREQRKFIEKWHLSSNDWLVQKDTPDLMQLVHRYSDTRKVLPKGEQNATRM